MMEHIRQHDWCSSKPDDCFLDEKDMDNCVIEKIIRNKFRDPMISSESEDDEVLTKPKIDWEQIFRRRNDEGGSHQAGYVAGCRASPPYPKLSSLTVQQQFQCLKVLCAQNPNVLPLEFIQRPMNKDYRASESLKETYLKEQQEYIEWAKNLWASSHSLRALRPRPMTENVYEAEFKMRANSLQSFPKTFEMAAHISLANKDNRCDINFKQDLVKVNLTKLPKVDPQEPLLKRFTIMRQCPIPEPCNKHPCWFTLPNEKEMSVLPLTEIHRELCQFGADSGAQALASEGALKCLVEMDSDWTIPLSVCDVISADGEKRNILVLGSEFSTHKKPAMTRTYRAFRHLLENALIPVKEMEKRENKENVEKPSTSRSNTKKQSFNVFSADSDSEEYGDDEWFGNLIINEDACSQNETDNEVNKEGDINNAETTDKIDEKEPPQNEKTKSDETNKKKSQKKKVDKANDKQQTKKDKKAENSNHKQSENEKKESDGFYTCSCTGSVFENPPLRSYKKWEIKNKFNNDKLGIIVHCSHKMKGPNGLELISEPIVEYQIDLGGSAQSDEKIKSLALSLFLRRHASLLNVRIDSCSGEVVTVDTLSFDDLRRKQPNVMQDISNVVYETVSQLQSLLPGHYILKHQRAHGANAFLFASRVRGNGDKLCLDFDSSVLAEVDEAKTVKIPPVLTDALLPVHKHRKILPLAFTPFERFVAKEPRKPPARTKAPPQALRWPKRKKKNKKNK